MLRKRSITARGRLRDQTEEKTIPWIKSDSTAASRWYVTVEPIKLQFTSMSAQTHILLHMPCILIISVWILESWPSDVWTTKFQSVHRWTFVLDVKKCSQQAFTRMGRRWGHSDIQPLTLTKSNPFIPESSLKAFLRYCMRIGCTTCEHNAPLPWLSQRREKESDL